mgnify:CR=1 FL=1
MVREFAAKDVPCLLAPGEQNPFISPEVFSADLPIIDDSITTVWLEGARHDLTGRDGPICDAVVDWMAGLA